MNYELENYDDDHHHSLVSSSGDGVALDSKTPDQSLLSRLYQNYFAKLVAGLRATYGAGPPDPGDIAQKTFTRLSARTDLDDIHDLEGYAWIAARNIMMSEKRALRVRADHAAQAENGLFGDICDNLDPERVLIAREELDLVMETLQNMPERRRKIFLACRVDGMTLEQAGRLCGVSSSAAIRHVAIATAAISEALGRIPPKTAKRRSGK
ncbi:MAG: sigma factor-like helix-turn-helix DNA-binding protein [Pseudomonadota bacterium]